MARNESPRKRLNPVTGEVRWQARWTDKNGKYRYGWKPDIPGTYRLKRDAQAAINACYEREAKGPALPKTVGEYAATWADAHPRARVTNQTNASRLAAALDIRLEGTAFRLWPFELLRRRHANMIADTLVREGRAYTGVNAILGTLSALVEDAIEDEVAVSNPFRGMKKIRAADPRVKRGRRAVRVWSWGEMHDFARGAAHVDVGAAEMRVWRAVFAEPMVRVLSDCGLRIGELLPLERGDLDVREATLRVQRSVSLGEVLAGTKTDHGEQDPGRTVPVPPELLGMLKRMMLAAPPQTAPWLFPAARGGLWQAQAWRRLVWGPACVAAGVDVRPHEFRHSQISLLRAAGIDGADLAAASGHTVETQTKAYTHSLGRSFDAMRRAVGE